MLILSVESATSAASVALIKDDGLLGEYTLNYKKQHSVLLMSLIDNLLKDNALTIKDVDAFVVSKGPGSFTGLRIGMATVKGLCMGSNKPLISVSSLDGLAFNELNFSGIICPIMDALRENVYTCFYKNVGGKLEKLIDHSHFSISELAEKLTEMNEPVIFVGDGVEKYRTYLEEHMQNIYFAANSNSFAKASSLGEIGLQLLNAGFSDDLNAVTPIYLRKSQAEREYDKKMELSNGI
ncbi:tRNA (adenosine(37)-N6)-threonylcarbamoyltransferase complex dimerization subunit type 1 TsaB [Inconstantimicrobium mannanitabidum]|uniref:tRNA (Adenosine(37)-N6)-threonylcarbamoyltransferase complex dimerization subunit type 1 TsaB n=1 Tax=Inconstantimicrobium mannanitabidum TaxID=1604901 RepID=A0ACB5R7D4_9CLOT|nr:tRNA (adenosine(37)-N6)-threonylcarbamoyltransferase complex dimerization subunit type 1 TsaB [Clostridium sp. TW13]GKX65020.1 tRNA (adenosine(37)-N6)-threonylcarbamoyltransferase complex dimerization subunit type 1 TsaB [Clostridium sp. TW13]